jgi:hypothetical protein
MLIVMTQIQSLLLIMLCIILQLNYLAQVALKLDEIVHTIFERETTYFYQPF